MRAKLKQYPLAIIFATVCIDMIGFGMLIPILPLLLADPTSSYFLLPAGWSVQSGYILFGFLIGMFSLGQFFAAPMLGQLSDKYGRKTILAISLIGTCLSYIVFAIGIITKNIPLLFAARFFDGLTGGNVSVAQAAIADITTPEHRARNFGLIGAAFGLGFILGPFIGGRLSDPAIVSWFHAATPFWFAAILTLLNVLSIVLFLPETLPVSMQVKKIEWARSFTNVFHAYSFTDLRVLYFSSFLLQGGFAFFTTFFSVYLITRFDFSQGNIGDMFAYIGICVALTQVLVTGRVTRRWREYQILNVTLFGLGIFMFIYLLPSHWSGLLIVTPLFAMFNGLSQVSLTGLISRSSGAHVQGEVLGTNTSVIALAQSIPPILSGFIAASLSPSASIVTSGIVILLAWVVFKFWYRPTKPE
jgi:DHA1 family tetracycline resistance protein-like MFS transporter